MTPSFVSSGSTFETDIGYARAVVDGEWICVSGTTGFDYRTMTIAEGVVDQAKQCVENIRAAMTQAGFELKDAIRVRYILPDPADFEPCWPVLREAFGPACAPPRSRKGRDPVGARVAGPRHGPGLRHWRL